MSSGSRAGWLGGMLRASKLWWTSSTSGPAGHGEPEPAEQVDQLVGGLGQRMAVPQPGTDARQRDVDRRRGRRACARRATWPPRTRLRERALTALNRWPYSRRLGRLERLEPLLGGLDPALLLPEELDARRLDRLGQWPRCRTRPARLAQSSLEIGQRIGERFIRRSSLGNVAQAVLAFWRAWTAASCLSSLARTLATIASNVSGSWIASSERLLRSRPIFASWSPWISRL